MAKLKCCGCKLRFDKETMIKHPSGYFHSQDCAITYAAKKGQAATQRRIAKEKAKTKALAKFDRERTRAEKESVKTLSELVREAQLAFNLYIRLRDFHKPCISCGKSKNKIELDQGYKTGGAWDAGHFKSRGAKKQLRFNTYNVHKQCKRCNGGGGKFSHNADTVDKQYRINLIKKIGLRKVEQLENNNDLTKNCKTYLRRMRTIFRKRAVLAKKRLKNAGYLI